MPSYAEVLRGLWSRVRASVTPEVRALAEEFGYRPYMVARYVELLGGLGEVRELLEAFQRPPPPAVRCNLLRAPSCGLLAERLEGLGYSLERVPWSDRVFVVGGRGAVSLGATHEFLLGWYYLHRGPGATVPPLLLGVGPGDRVLDAAAAPGGKASFLADLMRNEGVLVAVEVSRARVGVLRSNLERLGVRNAVVERMRAEAAPSVFGRFFGRVILDAPCTGEGLIGIDPLRKVRTSYEDLIRSHERQVRLLVAALNSASPGGRVLYTVCSIAPEEGEAVVAEALRRVSGTRVVRAPSLPGIDPAPGVNEWFGAEFGDWARYCWRLYPHTHGTEGFFICLLETPR